jgi:uncharacterized protein YkwD
VGRLGTRKWVIGALLGAAIVAVSVSALVFEGRDDGAGQATSTSSSSTSSTTSTTSTSTSTTTTSTTTATTAAPTTSPPPPPPPTEAPTPVVVVPPPPAPAPVCDGGGSAVIDAMNRDRASAGLGGLCASSQLNGFAQSWANWMAAHQSLSHQDLGAVLAGTSFSSVAENILAGPGGMSSGDMEAAWMASPGHRENIMNGAYTAAGVGVAYSGDGQVWVAVEFGG